MPICLRMKEKSFSGISSARLSWSILRTPVMRPDIIAISSFHSLNIAGSFTTSATMRAPCTGGLEYMARATRLSWLRTLVAASGELSTALRAPMRSPYRPRFFAYDWLHRNSIPLDANSRGAKASSTRSPLAKPW